MDTKQKHEEQQETELQKFRDKFAGAKLVRCPIGNNHYGEFDFTEVKPKEIRYSVHGNDTIITVAKSMLDEEREVCYLKREGLEATVIEPVSDKDFTVDVNYSYQYEPDKLPVDLLIDYIKKYSICTPHSERFSHQVLDLFDIRLREGSLDKMELQNANDIIHWNKVRTQIETSSEFETFVTDYCDDLRNLLIKKNKSYGNSALEPVRIFSKASSEEQLFVRIDDKLSRIKSGNNDFNEDTIQDIQGYLILLQFKKAQEK